MYKFKNETLRYFLCFHELRSEGYGCRAPQPHPFRVADGGSRRRRRRRRQQNPLSPVTGAVNNPVCDPGDAFEDAAHA